jgi:hypothetical protein
MASRDSEPPVDFPRSQRSGSIDEDVLVSLHPVDFWNLAGLEPSLVLGAPTSRNDRDLGNVPSRQALVEGIQGEPLETLVMGSNPLNVSNDLLDVRPIRHELRDPPLNLL